MTIKTVTAVALDRAIRALDPAPPYGGDPRIDVEPRYSGRGMYGATCLGVILDDQRDLVLLGAALDLGKPSLDSMGLSYIGYWPGVTLEGTSRYQETDEWMDDEDEEDEA